MIGTARRRARSHRRLTLASSTPDIRRGAPYLGLNHGDIVHAAGTPIAFAAEIDRVPANIDHFWITIGLGTGDPIRVALSTHSRQNAAAGFDPRLRLGIVASTWTGIAAGPVWRSRPASIIARSDSRFTGKLTSNTNGPHSKRLLAEKAERAVLSKRGASSTSAPTSASTRSTACVPVAVSPAI